jgi:CheY-like chemotaxis protein
VSRVTGFLRHTGTWCEPRPAWRGDGNVGEGRGWWLKSNVVAGRIAGPVALQQEITRPHQRLMISSDVFNVWLDRGPAPLPDSMSRAMQASMTGTKGRILVVDDDEEVREILVETLEEFGYSVVQAESGEEALQVLDTEGEVRMLITDVRMPGISGLELAEIACRKDPSLRVILMSGYFLPQQVMQRFLKKPFHMADLAAAVSAELAANP